jgi:hypothetical protein
MCHSVRIRQLACMRANPIQLLAALFVLFGAAHAFGSTDCVVNCAIEPEPVLKAPLLVQPALLSGPDFHVVPEVAVRGYMADFLIDTKFGPLHADSVELLAARVAELPALETLERASRTDAFAHALAERGRKTGSALVHVLGHPVDTVTGLPAGVARYFSHEWDLWSDRAVAAADRSSREFENKGDPFAAPPGPMTARRDAPGEFTAPDDRKNHAWYARAGAESEREAKRYLKYAQQRREMAKVLGVDPNTTNPLLSAKLDSLAWAAVWGNFSAGSALGTIGGTTAEVISYSGRINRYVYDLEPEQLRELNAKRLAKYCSDDYAVRQFLRRGGFTDTLRTDLVDAFDKLQPTGGCNDLVELAASTHGEVEARYLVDAIELVAQQTDARGGKLLTAGAALAYRTPAGKLLLPLPLDYLTWNADMTAFFDRPDLRSRDKFVLIGGNASILAQRELTARGWSLALGVRGDGAAAYAQSAGGVSALR